MGGEGGSAAGCGSTPNAPLSDEKDAIVALAYEAVSAIGTGGHGHWREVGFGGKCGACIAAVEREADLRQRLDALVKRPAAGGES